jgi:hypothetical protein
MTAERIESRNVALAAPRVLLGLAIGEGRCGTWHLAPIAAAPGHHCAASLVRRVGRARVCVCVFSARLSFPFPFVLSLANKEQNLLRE